MGWDRSCGELWTDSRSILGRNIWTQEVPRGNNSCRITKHLVVSPTGRNPPNCVGRTNEGRKDWKAPMESQSLADKNFLVPYGSFSNDPPSFNCVLSTPVLYKLVHSQSCTFRWYMASVYYKWTNATSVGQRTPQTKWCIFLFLICSSKLILLH